MANRFPNTVQQRSRRVRALELVRKRADFWTEQKKLGDTVTVDGKECSPEEKFRQCELEESNLLAKL